MKLNLRNSVPSSYNYASWVDIISKIETQVNGLAEGRKSSFHGRAVAPPTYGSYVRGDFFLNDLPSATGYFGWICTESGTPGTWHGFGLIVP